MLKKYPAIKWILVSLLSLLVLIIAFGVWFMSLLPKTEKDVTASRAEDLPYLTENVVPKRGKILAVVTSTGTMGESGKKTGYELTELSRAYYVFEANGFEVDVASPKGGKPPVVLDDDDMGPYDYAFLNDSVAQYKTSHTIPMENVKAADYEAIYFVGGKGAMFDFPNNPNIQSMVREYYQSGKVVGAVCHGPAALVNVSLDNGTPLLQNKTVSGFTNKEELLLIPEASTIFPFLLQDELVAQGARFNEGAMYLETVSHDGNLVTGQNPWSTWRLAEIMVKQLGYKPKFREITSEENAVRVLMAYENGGTEKAKQLLNKLIVEEKKPVDRVLLATHSLVGVMKGDIGQFFGVLGLTSYAKKKAKVK